MFKHVPSYCPFDLSGLKRLLLSPEITHPVVAGDLPVVIIGAKLLSANSAVSAARYQFTLFQSVLGSTHLLCSSSLVHRFAAATNPIRLLDYI